MVLIIKLSLKTNAIAAFCLQVLLNQEAAPVEAVCAYIFDVLYSKHI
jgi:hypothetical protein